ncbi:MAG: LAGLIDADG family homing endonuclease [Halobacteriaceae archaeon]
MARAENQELVERFEQFYRRYYSDDIGELARRYPREQKSLGVEWADLYQFDPDLAEDFVAQPDQLQEYAEEALRLYDLPVDVSLGQAHVRLSGVEATEIRDLRSEHVSTMVAVKGMIRKATDVRPKVQEAAFECQRCGTLTYVPQSSGTYQEPHECEGCERQGPFQLNVDQSEFVDSQKLRIQESPEGLRGGETPQSIDVNVEDDLTGVVSPGDHVTVTGVLRLDQQGGGQDDSPVFDIYMDGRSVSVEDEEYEDMDIDDEDKADIAELSDSDDIYEMMVDSIAPAIYGHRQAKLAMALQLFSGVTKHLPDGSRTRGDLHMLLIGDPGTGKCLDGDTPITLADGSEVGIREFVEANLDDPKPIDDGVYDTVDAEVPSLTPDGRIEPRRATKVWKREAPEEMYRIATASGRVLTVTPSHPLFVQSGGDFRPIEASDLDEGDFVATPRHLPEAGDDELAIEFRRSKSPNAVRLDPPSEWTPWLARFVGYVVAEGYATLNDDNTADLRVTNNDRAVLDDVTEALDRLGVNWTERNSRSGTAAAEIICTSSELVRFLHGIEPAVLDGSAAQRVPESLFRASPEIKAAFLEAYVEGEGHVSSAEREITVASMSETLLGGVRSLLLSLGVGSSLESRHNGSYRLRISGEDFVRYVESVGFVTERKSSAAEAFGDADRNTNRDVVPDVGDDLRRVREALALSQRECGVPRTTYQHYERGDRNPSRESLDAVVSAFEDRLEHLRTMRAKIAAGDWDDITAVRRELRLSQQTLADGMDVTQTAISYYEREDVAPDGGHTTDARDAVLNTIDEALAAADDVRALRSLAESDVRWDRIESIETVEPDDEWVYDLEVGGTHSYVSNGIVSHNSQLLQYIRHISPRSVYTSGKGSSSAGLTAAAVRDDFGDGQQWTLEAGAVVLADKGVAAVDELDKMEAGDRSALHEALEQQTVSISKAGINATLKARCSLLGAANPKHGRFDQYEGIGEQIDLEPALISRFDLIFTVTDQPDEERDAELADHILKTNYAGELNTHRTEMTQSNVSEAEVESVTDDVAPAIEPELLRKYVAYSRRNIFPTMTEAAMARIREFYVDLRAQGTGEDAPVPVTARKLEALVRLAEASARVRLADEVTEADADRVIEIVRKTMEDVGMDPETGEFDADVIETGTSKSQRDRIRGIKDVIDDLQDEYDEGAPLEKVLDAAEADGMERSKAENEIENLKQKGEIYQPSPDHFRTL